MRGAHCTTLRLTLDSGDCLFRLGITRVVPAVTLLVCVFQGPGGGRGAWAQVEAKPTPVRMHQKMCAHTSHVVTNFIRGSHTFVNEMQRVMKRDDWK